MILSISNLHKAFGDTRIIQGASFHIEEGQKAAIVGINGAGKTTLLKIIIGELKPDEGTISLARGASIGYLAQHQDIADGLTVYEALLQVKKPLIEMEERIRFLEQRMKSETGEALTATYNEYSRLNHIFEQENGYAIKSEVTGILKGLGFSQADFEKNVSTLSGGQKTRVSLGRLLLTKPNLLLLDEPTNHLDMASISWLETYLKGYPGSIIVVAHDRYFLDRVVTKVIEIENTHVSVYSGNYTAYSEKKAALRDAKIRAYLNQQQQIRHQEAVITRLKSFNREKSIRRAESREKMLDRMERLDNPKQEEEGMDIRLEPAVVSGNDVLSVASLSKSFGTNRLFTDVSFEIKRGERVAVIGDNGTGKTTLLKIINGLTPPSAGLLRLGANVHIGYYDQEQQLFDMEKTIFEEIQDTYPDMGNTQVRNTLASFLFTGDDVFKKVSALSGGERGRLALAKLMLSKANFLLLDEPTNHLDILSKEILESALNRYGGTVLFVSHDRYFINRTATRILNLTGHTFVNYIGNYDYYLEKKEAAEAAAFSSAHAPGKQDGPAQAASPAASKQEWQNRKEEQARIRKLKADFKKTEEEIHRLEERSGAIDRKLTEEDVFTNPEKLSALALEKEALDKKLNALYELWEQLAELTEGLVE